MSPEAEACRRCPSLVVASLGAVRKEKTQRRGMASVLRRDARTYCESPYENQGPGALTDSFGSKRALREKAKLSEQTFALSADVSEAHRQEPTHPRTGTFQGAR